jgi:ATP-dependent exoDNAse (exonuclease V) alpha subunit
MSQISNQLRGTLSGFNGARGKKTKSPEEFYNSWSAFKIKKINNPSARNIINEAIANKAEVMRVIESFFQIRQNNVNSLSVKVERKDKKKPKKWNWGNKKGNELESIIELEPSEVLDVYYISGGIDTKSSLHERASVCILKNNQVVVQEAINNKTCNEAEFLTLIRTLTEIKDRKTVIYSNSKFIVDSINKNWKLKAENLKPLRAKVKELMGNKDVKIQWIPYLRNKAAQNTQKSHTSIKKIRLNEKRVDFSKITLSMDQKEILKKLQEAKEPIFLTGKAGTGKSLLLQYFRQNTDKNVVVCAPTGVAALNIGGQTIHSLFRIPPGFVEQDSLKLEERIINLIKHIDVVVIDEVSMVSPDLLDAIDYRLRQGKENSIPFGGAQVLMFGDLFQLPPIPDKELHDYFEKSYGGYFFFNAHVWRKIQFKRLELTTVFRQKDEEFKTILNAVRDGSITEEQLNIFNKRAEVAIPPEGVITLVTTNNSAKRLNETRLNLLKDKAYEYTAEITGTLEKSAFPTDEILTLKKGSQVMLLKNDKEKRWVNGTLGVIDSLTPTEIKVNMDGNIYLVPKEKWEKIRYSYNSSEDTVEAEVVSSFTQFPLRLAWAITVHKSQGQTYNSVAIDMGFGAFAHGQTYVALSRCRTLEGLYLKRRILLKDIIVESKIIDFMGNNRIND